MVLQYAKGGNFNSDNWISTLVFIIQGLGNIHEKNMVHHDFHIGNILLEGIVTYISDMGLCGKVGNMDATKIYGVCLCSS